MELVRYEYLPSPRSMAAGMYDLGAALKQKYLRTVNPVVPPPPYKVLQADRTTRQLSALLPVYTTEILKNIAQITGREIKYNVRKDILIPTLIKGITKNFADFLTMVNDDMFKILLALRHENDVKFPAKSIAYLIKRAYLFRIQSDEGESLVMPQDLIDIMDASRDPSRFQINGTVCHMGKNMLYFYGVMSQHDFDTFLLKAFDNYQKGRLDSKINFADLRFSDYYDLRDLYPNIQTLFEHYAWYSKDVKAVIFDIDRPTRYYSHHSVGDPFNINFEHDRREAIEFLPLSCNDLLADHPYDQRTIDNMSNYISRSFALNPMRARMLVDEWTHYVKSGDNHYVSLSNIVSQLGPAPESKINALLQFFSLNFANDLNQWLIKGHTPNDLRGIDPTTEKSIAHSEPATVKVGRNDPCSCGSGKKYKKCCGRLIQ